MVRDFFRKRWTPLIHEGERTSVLLATVWLFFLLLGYFVIRPVRETLGSLVDSEDLKQLFYASFLTMLAAVPAYGVLVNSLSRRWLVRVVYQAFALCLVGFWIFLRSDSEVVQAWAAWVLFVWISFFGVFATTVFWSVLADLFSSRQAKRLFGFIAAGGTAGAFVGSLLTSQLAQLLTKDQFMLLPIVVIELGLLCAWMLEKQVAVLAQADRKSGVVEVEATVPPARSGWWNAVTHILRSRYLQFICIFIFFVQFCGTQMYFQQAAIVKAALPEESDRTQLFANIDLATQVLTLVAQLFLSSFILRFGGVAVALMVLPVIYLGSFSTLAYNSSLQVMVIAVVIGRAAGYGITVPAREVLFTVVKREDKYKSKGFIDTVVLRGSDAASASTFTGLEGLGLRALNLCLIPVVVIWIFVSWRLGRFQEALAGTQEPETEE
ncbi:MAG: NTP/NDP exchange transporter [Rubripirellula sp.]|jgi:AAA family ATP:ADP antiporter